jgi:hypothetical protein
MKTIGIFLLFLTIASFSWASDLESENKEFAWETYPVISRLLMIKEPSAPLIYENFAIFTADSNLRRVGIAFSHENFSSVHWFTNLLIMQDRFGVPIPPGQKFPDPYKDSGIQFFVYQIPDSLRELEYRLIINGLWTIDPANQQIRRDPFSGLSMSVIALPHRAVKPNPLNGLPDGLHFTYTAPPGEIVSVAGNFNSWDPFMYELREGPAGQYSITIPLPPGTYQYLFYHRGQRHTDPHNPQRIYARDGSAASLIVVP